MKKKTWAEAVKHGMTADDWAAYEEPKRYVLIAVTGRDRADQRVHTEVFYTREAALKACDVLAPYGSIEAVIIEDSHG